MREREEIEKESNNAVDTHDEWIQRKLIIELLLDIRDFLKYRRS